MISIMDEDGYTFAEDNVLYRLGTEPEYREALLGAPSADWGLIARHLKKSPESAQRRFLELKIMPEADDRTESDVSIDIEGQPEMPAGPAGIRAVPRLPC